MVNGRLSGRRRSTAEMQKPRVLIVDDDARIREQISATLEAEGFEACPAGDALDAYSLLESAPGFALMVIDILIPGRVDGLLFAQLAAERSPGTPIIVISGKESPEPTDVPPGATVLKKPCRPDEIAREARLLVE